MRSILVILTITIFGCTEGRKISDVPLPRIRIALDKPTNAVVGHTWPKADHVLLAFTAVKHPRRLTIELPSGHQWMTDSQITFFSQKQEVVASVIATPLDEATSFATALIYLKKTTEELGVDKNQLIVAKLGAWETNPPSWDPFATRSISCEVEPGITFFGEIKPATDSDKWYLSYHFTVDRFFTQ